jgi:hypothetical protein
LLLAGLRRSIQEVGVVLEPEADADVEDVEWLGRRLPTELRSLRVDGVSALLPGGSAGSKDVGAR